VKGHPNLEMIAEALLSVRAVLLREFNVFEKRVRAMSRLDAKAKLLMSTPAVGPIVSLTYAAAVDDPARFKSSKRAERISGWTPKRCQSGETDYSGRISKIGDASVREALYQAAHVMLTKPVKGCPQLKSWAMRIARRAGMSKAKVALARKARGNHASHAQGRRTFSIRSPRHHRNSLTRRSETGFREGHHTSLPEAKVPSPGRWYQVRPPSGLSTHLKM